MLKLAALVLIGAFSCASSAPLTCSKSVDYFSAVIDTTLLWHSPSVAPDGVCDLPSTCCSASAIAAMKAVSGDSYSSQVSALTLATKGSCFNGQVEDTVASFLTVEKVDMRDKAQLYLGIYYSNELGLIFDEFADSAGDYMLGTKPLCGLEGLVPELAFKVFWAFAQEIFSDLRTASSVYQECAKAFVNDRYSSNIQDTRRSFEQRLLRVVRILKYRNATLTALSALEREALPQICLTDLVSMRYCDGCGGLQSEASLPCLSTCKFAMGTCLTPYQGLTGIINDWTQYARELSGDITNFNSDYMFAQVPWGILDIAADLTIQGQTIRSQMDDRCIYTGRRKRATETQSPAVLRLADSTALRSKRQSAASMLSALLAEVDCLTTLVTSQRHEAIAAALCVNTTTAAPCDNSAIVSRNLSLQLSNPLNSAMQELNWQRKYILSLLLRCNEDEHGVCPDVSNYCWERPPPPTPSATTVSPSTATASSPTSTAALPTTTPPPTTTELPPCTYANTGKEPQDQETGDIDSEDGVGSGGGPPGACMPTTPTISTLPTVPRADERTGDGVAIQCSSSCLTALLVLLSAVFVWAF